MFRIHDILVWIRIRIGGSMPLTNGSGSCYFCHWPSRGQTPKKIIFYNVFLLITFWRYIHIIFKDTVKSPKKSRNRRNQSFFFLICLMIEGSEMPKNMWIWWIIIIGQQRYQHQYTTWKYLNPRNQKEFYWISKLSEENLCVSDTKKQWKWNFGQHTTIQNLRRVLTKMNRTHCLLYCI